MTAISRPSLFAIVGGVLIACVLAGGIAIAILTSGWTSELIRTRMIGFLEARFSGKVEISEISISLLPRISIKGSGLTIVRSDTSAAGPFVRLNRFHLSGSPLDLLKRKVRLAEVDDFEFHVARGSGHRQIWSRDFAAYDIVFERFFMRRGLLLILPNDPHKLPLRFDLDEVVLDEFSFDRSCRYRARLTNPKPKGIIDCIGRFGPLNTIAPRSTPLFGGYTFSDVQLATIKGIGGTLGSTGSFKGVLGRIEVRGATSTPDFQLELAGQPLMLETRFHATVDGTTGDTYLEDVDAKLGGSRILATGSIAGHPGSKARTVSLAVKVDKGRFEDFTRLAVRAIETPMTGVLGLDCALELPPSEDDISQRLRLKGRFSVDRARFAGDAAQERIDTLSRRGRGEPGNLAVQNMLSAFSGVFTLRDGLLRLPRLQFRVSGAAVDLAGTYRLKGEELDFAGTLKLVAPLSKTTTGFKSLLLKAADPYFRGSDAGTVLPIKVTGSVDKPAFGLDIGKALMRK